MKLVPNTIHACSCFDLKRGLSVLPDKSFSHVITDPPYEKHVHAGNRRSQRSGGKIVTPDMGFAALTEEERFVCAHEFVRLSRGWILVFCALEGVRLWQDMLLEAGAKRRTTQIWNKPSAAPKFAGDGPSQACEAIVTMWAGQGKSIWNAGGAHGIYRVNAERTDRRHPTQKPPQLMQQIVADFTQPGDLILDPYAGGGATLLAAAEQGRDWYGYEREPDMAELARLTALHARPQFVLPRAPKHPTKPRKGAKSCLSPTVQQAGFSGIHCSCLC